MILQRISFKFHGIHLRRVRIPLEFHGIPRKFCWKSTDGFHLNARGIQPCQNSTVFKTFKTIQQLHSYSCVHCCDWATRWSMSKTKSPPAYRLGTVPNWLSYRTWTGTGSCCPFVTTTASCRKQKTPSSDATSTAFSRRRSVKGIESVFNSSK